LYDLGYIGFDEPFKRLLNQGKIGGDSRLVYRIRGTQEFVSAGLKEQYETDELHVDVSIVDGFDLDMEAFKKWKPDFANASFITENGVYKCGGRLEKMSKRYFNVVNPDDIVERYGADTFRLYEMFLGPVEQDKPWDTKGIEGVHRFIKKFWRLFYDTDKGQIFTNEPATDAAWKVFYKVAKKIEEDTLETTKEYPIAINGKTRTTINLDINLSQQEVEELVMKDAVVIKWLEGNAPKKIIYVKNKMINVVL